jgi:TatD DNase family protein
MIDTHCHLQTEAYNEDRASVLSESMAAGVEAFVVPAIDHESFAATIKIASENELVFCALGIHPHSATEWSNNIREEIAQAVITNDKIVAIGEIGLDYHYDFSPRDVQQKAFAEQIELAIELGKPIVIHTRESDEDVLKIVADRYKNLSESAPRGQFHCFSGTVDTLHRAIDLGFYVSFTGNITFKKSMLDEVVHQAPIERIMLETDSPYMTPVPDRGKRNTPAYLGRVAQKIADIKGMDVLEVITQTTLNAKRLFRLSSLLLLLLPALWSSQAFAQRTGPIGNKPPDSVMTDDRRKMEEAVRKQREELQKEEAQHRQDSIKAVDQQLQEAQKVARDQMHQDSVKAAEKLAEEERARLKALTPIAWKAIGVGGGIGIGNMAISQQKPRITPTSVLATSFQVGTQISRVLDFQFSYAQMKVSDDLTGDRMYNAGIGTPSGVLPGGTKLRAGQNVPTYEELAIKWLSFDLRFVITPRNAFKFYAGLGYTHLTMSSLQNYRVVNAIGAPADSLTTLNPNLSTYSSSFSRGGIKLLFGIREDIELGSQWILTPFAEIAAVGAFAGTTQGPTYVFLTDPDQITMTHLNVGVTLYFGWFGVERYPP